MSTSLLTLIAWAPFLLVVLICGIIFTLLGYKRGSARGGIAIGVTLLSAILSVFVAKLLSGTLTSTVSPMIGDALADGFRDNPTALETLADGLSKAVCATVLYLPVFLILGSILKNVAAVITKKFLKAPKAIGNRLGGLGLGLLDAILFAFLLLLPIYGTLGVANTVMERLEVIGEMSEEDEVAEGMETINAVVDQPLSDLASVFPFSTMYDGLMTFSYEGDSVCLPRILRDASDVVADAVLLEQTKDPDELRLLAHRLAGNASDLLSEVDFLLVLVGDFAAEEIPEVGGINFGEAYDGFRNSDLMKKDLPAIFDLLLGVVDSGVVEAFADGSYNPATLDMNTLADALGTGLNATESLAKFKATVVREAVKELVASEEMTDNLRALIDAVSALPETPYDAENARKEGESLAMILNGILLSSNSDKISGEGVGYLIEGLARHPAIDVDVVMNAAEDLLVEMDFMAADGSATAVIKPLKDALLESLDKPFGESTFPSLTDTAVNTVDTLQSIVNGEVNTESMKEMLSADAESLSTMKEMVTEELLTDFGLEKEAAQMNTLLGTMFDAIADNDLSEEELEKEATVLSDALITFNQAAGMTEEAAAEHFMDNADKLLSDCLESQIITDTLDTMTENGESDPLNLFTGLDEDNKASLEEKLDELGEEVDAETIENLKLFMGLTD